VPSTPWTPTSKPSKPPEAEKSTPF
jgi:hypothetical protein